VAIARTSQRQNGVSLVEIVVGIAIIAVLVAIFSAVIVNARRQGKSAACLSNLSQIGKAMLAYAADHNDCIPPAQTWKELLLQYGVAKQQFFCPLDPITSLQKLESKQFGVLPDLPSLESRVQTSYDVGATIVRKLGERHYSISGLPDPANLLYAGDAAIERHNYRGGTPRTAHGEGFNGVFYDGSARYRSSYGIPAPQF
jgi:prepilin-type N-terminal cleavage/methylation domain-containing protein/prepilin-type processing-associated H-X9-DG protein